MARSTHPKKWYVIGELFSEEPEQSFFTLTPDTREKLLNLAKELRVTESFVVEALIRNNGLENAVAYYKEKGFNPNEKKKFKSLNRYGQNKKSKSLSLTPTSSQQVSDYAAILSESRSEILECAIRGGGLIKSTELISRLTAGN